MKKDLGNIEDIKLLIDSFYKKVIVDPTISHFFTEVVKISWEKHIPIMYSFWDTVLFGTMTYKGNPMIKHIELDKKEHLNKEHFAQWIKLWEETIDDHFSGAIAEKAKQKAESIEILMLNKIEQSRSV